MALDESRTDAITNSPMARQTRARFVAAGIANFARSLATLIERGVLGRIRAYLTRRRHIEELLSMDDHMLRDMGLSRSDIRYALDHGRGPANDNAPLKEPDVA